MESGQDRKGNHCRIVVGADEAAAARAAWPDVPIVALVQASDPTQAVLARSAGADVVLPIDDLASGWRGDTPGLAVAVSAACSLAERRVGVRESSRRAAHDLGQALSAINLAAELALGEDAKNERLLLQIRNQAQDAGSDAWRAGRAGRSAEAALRPVDMSALLHRIATAEPDVAVYNSSESAWVLGDVARIEQLLEELIQHGRQSATNQRIDIALGSSGKVEIMIRGTGKIRSALPESEVEFGLEAVSEIVNDLGGSLDVGHAKPDSAKKPHSDRPTDEAEHPLTVRLLLPLLPYKGRNTGLVTVPPDNMAIQADILEGVLRHAPLSESLEAIVQAIEQHLPGTVCSVLTLKEGVSLHHAAGSRLPKAYRDEIDGVAIGFGQGSCGTAAFLARPIIAADVETDQHWAHFKDVALEHNLRSCWSTPILAADGGSVLGTFAVYRPEVWEPDEAARQLVSRFTYLAAVAIGHHRLFKAVAESESRFRGAFEGATAGMALVAPDGSFLKVNPALCTMLESDNTNLCERNLLDLVSHAHRDRIEQGWSELLAGAANQSDSHRQEPVKAAIEVPIVDHSGDEPLWVSLRSSLVNTDDDDEQPHFYIEILDIGASRRHAIERQAREAAESANLAKTDFLALVSHELRTPLNAILGFAQIMQLVELDAAQRASSVDNILKAGQHLLDLINELLDLSLIEAGQLSTVIEDVDANEAIDEALQIVRPLADSRNISLHSGVGCGVDRGPGQPVEVAWAEVATRGLAAEIESICSPAPGVELVLRADRQCLRQVLLNLLGNAVKFTPAGGDVGIVVSSAAEGTVKIQVLDSGPGIPAEAVNELFQPFHRLAPKTQPQPEGTGLGLSVAARLVTEMHGAIGVDSQVGSGSCFWVDLPGGVKADSSELASSAMLEPAMPASVAQRQTSGTVLYIEDDPASVQVIASALALRPGIELHTAATVADGLAAASSRNFDAIMLDIGLPDGSGWDLLRTLRDKPATASTPALVLTATRDTVPPDGPSPEFIMTKPVDVGLCLQAIDSLLQPGNGNFSHATESLVHESAISDKPVLRSAR